METLGLLFFSTHNPILNDILIVGFARNALAIMKGGKQLMKKKFNPWMIASLIISAAGVFIANKADDISREETKAELKAELLEELNHENEEES